MRIWDLLMLRIIFLQAETAIYENNKNEACILVKQAKQEIDNWFKTKLRTSRNSNN